MVNRRWFSGPRLTQWRFMVECGDYGGPFFSFPYEPSFRWNKSISLHGGVIDVIENRMNDALAGKSVEFKGPGATYGEFYADRKV